MSRGGVKVLYVISIIILIVAVLICSSNQNRTAAILCMLVWAMFAACLTPFLRCPSCGRMPGRSWLFASYCPYCGESLD